VIVFLVLMSSTWYIINSEAAVPLETHVGIQAKLAQLLVDAVKAKKPDATNVEVDDVWTEAIGSGQPIRVKAHFTYHFSEPSAESGSVNTNVQGEAVLEKQGEDALGMDRWSLTEVKTNTNTLNFEQALVITTGTNEAPEAPAPAPAETH
jgi:hypothetical protein